MRRFQYNKTEILNLQKELQVRVRALPTLESKEAALRGEVQRVRLRLKQLKDAFETKLTDLLPMARLWSEFPSLVRVTKVHLSQRNIAGVKVDVVSDITYFVESFSLFNSPSWFLAGIEVLKGLLRLKIEHAAEERALKAVETARRKTTQKVNLYKKVQIPAYEDSIRKIKRFLEDEETIAKSSQKILKKRFLVVTEAGA